MDARGVKDDDSRDHAVAPVRAARELFWRAQLRQRTEVGFHATRPDPTARRTATAAGAAAGPSDPEGAPRSRTVWLSWAQQPPVGPQNPVRSYSQSSNPSPLHRHRTYPFALPLWSRYSRPAHEPNSPESGGRGAARPRSDYDSLGTEITPVRRRQLAARS